MVMVLVVIAGVLFIFFFKLWLAIPLTILTLVTLRAIQFRLMARTAEDKDQGSRVFFASILLMCLGYFIPFPVPPEKELLVHLCPLAMGAWGFWYHAPSVGLSRVGGFIIAALCVGIPTLGALLGFSPFSLR